MKDQQHRVIREAEARLLREIREEVIQLLFNRYVFRTHQEIVRSNARLQGRSRSIFSEWAQVVYAVANVMGVRRLASATFEKSDANLVRFLEMLIHDPRELWTCFERNYPSDAARARAAVASKGESLDPGWEILACKQLIGEDRKSLIIAAEKANRFAGKRAAHSVPAVELSTTFSELDVAINELKRITEKSVFLEAWAKPETLALQLGEMEPPSQKG